MDRRNFLRLAVSGVAVATALKGSLLQPRRLMAATTPSESLALSVITDRPDTAISKLQTLFQNFDPSLRPLTFEEFMLPGVHIGDIVVVRNNALIDYRQLRDGFSGEVFRISRELDMPREMKAPVLLKFSTAGKDQKASTINVYHRQTLVKQFDLNDQLDGEKIEGTKGVLHVTLNHRHVHIVAASCKHKTCMNMGSIYKPGQNLVCIPNELRITIAGEDQLGIDGVVF